MRRLAIKWDQVNIDADGHIAGHDAGATLVRRLVKLTHNPIVIGPATRRCEGFDEMPLEFVDTDSVVVINMDVLDSTKIWRVLREHGSRPAVMNFQWAPTTTYSDQVPQLIEALSFALFPTFANSERTASAVKEVVKRWTVRDVAEQAKVGWSNLGFRVEHVLPRRTTEIPVVLYPAIYLSERKRPKLFVDVVERVHRKQPIRVAMRPHELRTPLTSLRTNAELLGRSDELTPAQRQSVVEGIGMEVEELTHLVSELAMELSGKDWFWVGPLTATRVSYWEALAATTAFLATAEEESYGLEYVEAMAAGVIGILPDATWARALVPAGYPFLWKTATEAETLLKRAITEPDACRAELDAISGGDFTAWMATKHSDDSFEQAMLARLQEWFS